MEINKLNISPSDIGFNDLEALYNPDKLNWTDTQGVELPNLDSILRKQFVMGGLILLLNTPNQKNGREINDVISYSNINVCASIETEDINFLATKLDTESILFESEIKSIQQNRDVNQTDLNEQEIIDAYMKEVGSLYAKKRKFIL